MQISGNHPHGIKEKAMEDFVEYMVKRNDGFIQNRFNYVSTWMAIGERGSVLLQAGRSRFRF
jgi:hypothetical protein